LPVDNLIPGYARTTFDYDWKKRLKCEFNLSRNEQITSELMRWFHPHFHVIGQPDWLAVNPEPDEYDWIKVFIAMDI
jgi:hypothetical protein